MTPARSATHLVLIPSYNPGQVVAETVTGALQHWNPVRVVVDGSTGGSANELLRIAQRRPVVPVGVAPQSPSSCSVASFGSNGNFRIDRPFIPGGRLNILENEDIGIGLAFEPLDKLDILGTIRVRIPASGNITLCIA
ncbi:MAG: glycosyltransferase [Betaproteobacteria bacterium]